MNHFVLLLTQALLPLAHGCRGRYGRTTGDGIVSDVGLRQVAVLNQRLLPRDGMKTIAFTSNNANLQVAA